MMEKTRFSFMMRKEVYCIFITFLIGSIIAQSVDECITPKNEQGVCINILECQALQSAILEYRKNIESYNLIKASFCGYEGRKTKVCCPLEVTPPDTSESTIPVKEEISSVTSSSVFLPKSICGIVEVNHDRIVGGSPAVLGAWPWMAVLGYVLSNSRNNFDYQWNCGGSLITEKHVLTAAHCVVNLQGRKLSIVRLGELNLNPNIKDGATPLDMEIENVTVHEKYSIHGLSNDIALITLKNSVTFTKFIKPICLLEESDMIKVNYTKSMPYVAGWGSTNRNPSDDYRYPPITTLMEVQIPIITTSNCQELYKNYPTNVIDDKVICAGYPKGGKDSCRGDSGGPLMWPINKKFFLMGVVSYGTQICGLPGFPGVYSKVPSFYKWIENTLRQEK